MRLLGLQISSEYRNLGGVDINFDSSTNTHILIGNNGAGKSSVLEAISSIFSNLFYDIPNPPEFDYYLEYEKDGHTIRVMYDEDRGFTIRLDGEAIGPKVLRDNYLPSKLVCNYSGEDFRIFEKYYKDRYEDYEERLKKSKSSDVLRMVFIDKSLWKIMLLIMIACQDRVESFKKFLVETLHYRKLNELKIVFSEKILRTWNPNATTYYVNQINDLSKTTGLDAHNINPLESDARDLFTIWMNALPLVEDMSIIYNDGIDANYLSEGEKKLMSVLFIQEAISDENALILLDEPDSHIHVARKGELHTILSNAENRETILTSHSPTLTAKFPENSIIMLDRNAEGKAEVVDAEKQKIVSKLTNGIWTLQEQNIFLASNKDILVVEGKTDEVFLSKALEVFHKSGRFSDQHYCYLPSGGASEVEVVARHFTPKEGQLMVALFDADKAGWEAIKKIFGGADSDLYTSKKFKLARKHGNLWCAVYPSCRKNVTNFNIEDYFPRQLFLHYILKFKSLSDIVEKSKIKTDMAADCEKGDEIQDKQYSKFAKVFQLLKAIKKAEKEGRDVVDVLEK